MQENNIITKQKRKEDSTNIMTRSQGGMEQIITRSKKGKQVKFMELINLSVNGSTPYPSIDDTITLKNFKQAWYHHSSDEAEKWRKSMQQKINDFSAKKYGKWCIRIL